MNDLFLVVFNPFVAYFSFLHSLKTSENYKFSDVFRDIEIEHWGEMS